MPCSPHSRRCSATKPFSMSASNSTGFSRSLRRNNPMGSSDNCGGINARASAGCISCASFPSVDAWQTFSGVCKDYEAELVEFDGEDDHVHLLVNYPPKVSVSSLVNSLKGVSSRMIRKKNYPTIRRKLWGGALWSPSYFAGSCGGAPIAIIRQYIEQQQTPH